MTGIGLNAIFIVYEGGFCCCNEGSIEVDADVLKDLNGDIRSVKRTKTLTLKSVFAHGLPVIKDQEVTCITKMNTGNIFNYKGIISYISDSGNIGVKLISNAYKDGTKQLIDTIVSL